MIVYDARTGAISLAEPSGVTDHARLTFWLSRAPRVTVPASTYTLDPGRDGPLRIPSGIAVDLTGVTIQCAPQSSDTFDMLLIDGASDVTIRGGRIIGDRATHVGTTGEHGMGVRIQHSTGVTLDRVTLADHWGDCLYIGGGDYAAGEACRDIKVTGCTLTNARRQGISITHADGVTIDGCSITDINGTAPQYGIDVETNDPDYPCRNVSVRDCTFSGSVGGGVVVGSPAVDVTVSGCTFDGDSINLHKVTRATVTGCTVTGAGIGVTSGSKVVAVTGNTLTDGVIALYTSTGTDLSDVTVTGNILVNADGSADRKALTNTGSGGPISRIAVTGNVITGYVSESIFLYLPIVEGVIGGNVITSNPSRWVALLRGTVAVAGNRFVTSAAVPFSGAGVPATILADNTVTAP